jgi:hypothetical protein
LLFLKEWFTGHGQERPGWQAGNSRACLVFYIETKKLAWRVGLGFDKVGDWDGYRLMDRSSVCMHAFRLVCLRVR